MQRAGQALPCQAPRRLWSRRLRPPSLTVVVILGSEAVIPPKSNRREPWEYDRELYRQRNLIERAFNKLKQWRRIATRYDRRSIYFLSALYLVASVIWG